MFTFRSTLQEVSHFRHWNSIDSSKFTHLWRRRGHRCIHPPKHRSTRHQRCGRESTGTSHWWSQTADRPKKTRVNNLNMWHYYVNAQLLSAPDHWRLYLSAPRFDRPRRTPSSQEAPSSEPGFHGRGPWNGRQLNRGTRAGFMDRLRLSSDIDLTSDGALWGQQWETSLLFSLSLAAVNQTKQTDSQKFYFIYWMIQSWFQCAFFPFQNSNKL